MPQLQSLVLTDRATPTPVNRTFLPKDVSNLGVGTVVNSSGVPAGAQRVSVSMRQRASGNYHGELRLAVPVVVTETINGVSMPKVIRTGYATLTCDFDKTSSEQERNDVIGLMASALASGKVLVNDALVKLEGVY